MKSKVFRTYKVTVGRPRKDGGQVTASYGCNNYEHAVSYDLIWYDADGMACNGKSDIKPTKMLGECKHDHTCKNLGGFIIDHK